MNKFISKLVVICLVLLSLCGCSEREEEKTYNSLEELNSPGVTIGTWNGSTIMGDIEERFPEADLVVYNDNLLGYTALTSGKIDAFAFDRQQLQIAISNGLSGVKILDGDIGVVEIAVGLSPVTKITDLEYLINTFLKENKENGTIDDMYSRWVLKRDYEMPEIEKPADSNDVLVVGTCGVIEPHTFYKDNELTGFDIELANRFGKWANMNIEFKVYDFSGMIAAAKTGEIDCIISNLNVTEERKESIIFSEPVFYEYPAIMVRGVGELEYNSIPELNGKNIGIMTGTIIDGIVSDLLPSANKVYYSGAGDLATALKSGKVDAFGLDDIYTLDLLTENPDFGLINEPFVVQHCAFLFNKDDNGDALRNKMNQFLAEIEKSGLKDELYDKWINDVDAPMFDYESLPGPNGTITLGTEGTSTRTCFVRNGKLAGYEVELLSLFCEKYGYSLDYEVMDFAGMIPAVVAGKVDVACGCIAITEERAQSVYFSDSTFDSSEYFVVRKTNIEGNESFISNIISSFNRTFIKEGRYKMFINGCLETLAITVLSVIFGTILGFFAYLKGRKDEGLFSSFMDFMIWLIQGMPTVVLLMILYYVVFGSLSVSGFFVSIVGFSISFACSMYTMLRSGEMAIDKGQKEAAYTLGYTEKQTYFKIILPQSAVFFMPSYNAEIVATIKATAVVGYIAVQDITKIGDIVRSRTYEAFFPLIAVAVMYFVMAAILSAIVKKIDFSINPKNHDELKILKGVKQND